MIRRHESHTGRWFLDFDSGCRSEGKRRVVLCESRLITRHADGASEGAEVFRECRIMLTGVEDEFGESLDCEWWMSISRYVSPKLKESRMGSTNGSN